MRGEEKKKDKLLIQTNGVMDGEFLRVRVLRLSTDPLSDISSFLHLRQLSREINAFRPTNQTSASSLSLHIYPQVGKDISTITCKKLTIKN